MKMIKFEKGETYLFETLTGNKVHSLEVFERQTRKGTNEIRVFASLDNQKPKYFYGLKDDRDEFVRIKKWQTNVISTDTKEGK
jgi:hypothetical protein